MEDQTAIREALERNVKAVTLRPSVGRGTARTRVRLEPGLACEITEGKWSFRAGMHEKYGGSDAGPNPGILGRGALGSCLAIGYAMWAARLGVPIDALEVEIEADYDVRGELGVDETVTPGYQEVRYRVSVESPAPEAEVLRLLDTADRYSSYRDHFVRPVRLVRQVQLGGLAAGDGASGPASPKPEAQAPTRPR